MKRSRAAAALAAALACACPALAGTYQSVFALTTPYTASSPSITHVVLTWTSTADSGVIGLGDITEWSLELRSGGSTIFTDHAIVNDVVQTLGGVARSEADLRFQFDFAIQSYRVFDTMYLGGLLSGAGDTTYNAYLYQGFAGEPDAPLGIWFNGDEATRQEPGSSIHVFTAIPAPGAMALLPLALCCRRRVSRLERALPDPPALT